jgi:hypothetical protein
MTDNTWVAGLMLLGQPQEIRRMGELAAEPWKCPPKEPGEPANGPLRRRHFFLPLPAPFLMFKAAASKLPMGHAP